MQNFWLARPSPSNSFSTTYHVFICGLNYPTETSDTRSISKVFWNVWVFWISRWNLCFPEIKRTEKRLQKNGVSVTEPENTSSFEFLHRHGLPVTYRSQQGIGSWTDFHPSYPRKRQNKNYLRIHSNVGKYTAKRLAINSQYYRFSRSLTFSEGQSITLLRRLFLSFLRHWNQLKILAPRTAQLTHPAQKTRTLHVLLSMILPNLGTMKTTPWN